MPIITIPTRVTDTSSTVIDHVITNNTSHFIRPGVIQTSNISDHYPILCKIFGCTIPTNKKMHYTFRDKSNFDVDRYCTDINDFIFNFMLVSEVITETNFDDSFEAFVSIIQHAIDKHPPLKRMSRKQKKIKRKPKITRNIYQLICLKNKMHRTHYIKGDAAMKLKYKKFSNKLTKIKTNAKKKYFEEELEKNKSNPRISSLVDSFYYV